MHGDTSCLSVNIQDEKLNTHAANVHASCIPSTLKVYDEEVVSPASETHGDASSLSVDTWEAKLS
jgi:hypothetical protein